MNRFSQVPRPSTKERALPLVKLNTASNQSVRIR